MGSAKKSGTVPEQSAIRGDDRPETEDRPSRSLRGEISRQGKRLEGLIAAAKNLGTPQSEALRAVSSSRGVVDVIELLSRESGNLPSDVLTGALGLYKIGLDAVRDGNHLAIIDAEGDVVQEVADLSNRSTGETGGSVVAGPSVSPS